MNVQLINLQKLISMNQNRCQYACKVYLIKWSLVHVVMVGNSH